MSSPVFGREPSRPLPRDDDDSDPTLEIDLTEKTSAESEATGAELDGDDARRENDESAAAERGGDRDEPGSGAAAHEQAGDEAAPEGAPVGEGAPGPESTRERDEALSGEAGETDRLGEPAEADRLGEAGEPDQSGESDRPEGVDEVVGLDVAELTGAPSGESEASATRFDQAELDDDGSDVEPVVLDAEGVSAEPALGHPEPVMSGQVPETEPEGMSAEPAFSPGGNGFEGPWAELQLKFVDDPQSATAGALQLLREALGGLSPVGASTEELRVAFRRYRAAYHDLARN